MRQPARVIVLGCSGSGKSKLAATLAAKLDLPFIATDAIYWQPDWTPTPAADIRAWLEATAAAPRWVLDGNFDTQRDILWARADLAIWLDLPWMTTMARIIRRNLGWWISRTPIWGGQRLTWRRVIGGIRHATRSHGLKRRTYPAFLAAFPNLVVLRIRSQSDLKHWLAGNLAGSASLPNAALEGETPL